MPVLCVRRVLCVCVCTWQMRRFLEKQRKKVQTQEASAASREVWEPQQRCNPSPLPTLALWVCHWVSCFAAPFRHTRPSVTSPRHAICTENQSLLLNCKCRVWDSWPCLRGRECFWRPRRPPHKLSYLRWRPSWYISSFYRKQNWSYEK